MRDDVLRLVTKIVADLMENQVGMMSAIVATGRDIQALAQADRVWMKAATEAAVMAGTSGSTEHRLELARSIVQALHEASDHQDRNREFAKIESQLEMLEAYAESHARTLREFSVDPYDESGTADECDG